MRVLSLIFQKNALDFFHWSDSLLTGSNISVILFAVSTWSLYVFLFFFFYKDENESTKPRKEKHALFDYYYY